MGVGKAQRQNIQPAAPRQIQHSGADCSVRDARIESRPTNSCMKYIRIQVGRTERQQVLLL